MPFRPSRRALILGAIAIVIVGAGLGFLLWPEKGKDTIYNEETVAIMQRVMSPTSNGVDVGAFEGTLTKPMTRIAPRGEHWAIEPQPDYARLLRERFPHVHVCECALGDHDGTANFLLALDDPPRSGFREQDYPTEHERTKQITVRVTRLDDLVPDSVRISFIKIDVEGAEYLVLQGAKETIRRGQPAIAFEYGKAGMNHYGTTPEMMWRLVHDELGLDMQLMRTWLDGGRAYTADEFNRVVHESSDWMFVAYPRVTR